MTARTLILLLLSLGTVGCATVPMAPYQPTADSVVLLRECAAPGIAPGDFSPDESLPPGADQSLSVRGNTLHSPNGKSFALYLKESVTADLRAAGKLDPASPLVIGARLAENRLSAAGVSQASSTVAAKFNLKRGDVVLYDKLLRVEHQWESAFTGMIAIPEAMNQYTAQYPRLLSQLYGDAEFRKACSAGP